MLLVDIFLLLLLYIATAYIMVILYEKGASILGIRVFLISALILYIGFMHKPNDVWENHEFWIIGTIIAAHIFTINRNSFPYSSHERIVQDDDSANGNNGQVSNNQSSPENWFFSFLLFSWLFHDDDNDHF